MSPSTDPWMAWQPPEPVTLQQTATGGEPAQMFDMARVEMLAHTSAFLSWALAEERGLIAIPRLRVDHGGFDAIMRKPGSRRLAALWWSQAIGIELKPD